jgi:hypothetical protein
VNGEFRPLRDFDADLLQRVIELSKLRKVEVQPEPQTKIKRALRNYTDTRTPRFQHAPQFQDPAPDALSASPDAVSSDLLVMHQPDQPASL